jgi:hypothetical protein
MLTDLDYELLSAYIDGALTESERAAFELRLKAEPELSHELDELRATVTLLNNLPPRRAPRDFTLDARYARRSSFFLTSATFSALSTAAAIVLFALGAYLFSGNKAPTQPAAVGQSAQSQQGQLAFQPTVADITLDKSAAATATTESLALNAVEATDALENSPSEVGGFASPIEPAEESTLEAPQAADQAPLFQRDIDTPTELPNDGIAAGSASNATSSSDFQNGTSESTQTLTNQQYAAPLLGTPSGGGAVPPSPAQAEVQTDANAASAFAATQPLLTATLAPSATPIPTVTLTYTPSPTATYTLQPTATSTAVPTALPTETPLPAGPSASTTDSLPLLLIGLGIVFLIVAVATTLIRRRNRT